MMSKTGDESNRTFHEPNQVLEDCPTCRRETPHAVAIEILEESTDPGGTAYSREPYRVSVCELCETETQLRMNDQ